MTTAKIFRHGGSQAVRLPKAFRFEGTEVLIERRDDALGHASQNTPAPTGRKMPAQGNALGHTPQKTSSPEGAEQDAWSVVPLSEVVEINLRSGDEKLTDNTLGSFISMKCVEEESGPFKPLGDGRIAEVCSGYTPFRDRDVLFPKVTP